MLAFFPLLYYHAACRVLTPIITQQVKENNMNLKNKQEIIKEYGKNEKDTGSNKLAIDALFMVFPPLKNTILMPLFLVKKSH